MNKNVNLYEAIGGVETMDILIPAFYKRVQNHPDLIPIFPKDFTEVMRNQWLFMTQFLGGPPLYIQEKGHPRLRRRHLPFEITMKRRDAWLDCLHEAMTEIGIEEPYFTLMFERISMTASHMVNTSE